MIPVLSVRQPWAGLIVKGIKAIENRTWRTHYRGDLLIHASGKWDGHASDTYSKIRMNYRKHSDELKLLPLVKDVSITGHIIGMVNLAGITGLKLPRRVKVPECFKTLGEYLKDVSYKHSNHKTETVIVTPSDFRKEELYSKYPLDKVTAPFSMAIDRLWDKRLINGPTGALEVIKNLIRDDDSLYDRDRNILTGDGIAFNFDIESINEKIKNWLDSLEL